MCYKKEGFNVAHNISYGATVWWNEMHTTYIEVLAYGVCLAALRYILQSCPCFSIVTLHIYRLHCCRCTCCCAVDAAIARPMAPYHLYCVGERVRVPVFVCVWVCVRVWMCAQAMHHFKGPIISKIKCTVAWTDIVAITVLGVVKEKKKWRSHLLYRIYVLIGWHTWTYTWAMSIAHCKWPDGQMVMPDNNLDAVALYTAGMTWDSFFF